MKKATRRRRRRGIAFVEVLVASAILAVSLAGVASMWYFSYNMSTTTDTRGAAYAIGRHVLEEIKETGFRYASEGTTTLYYDSNGGSASTTSSRSSAYQVTVVITSDKFSTSTSGGTVPADDALRTVVLTVTRLSDNTTVYQTGTYLVRSGV